MMQHHVETLGFFPFGLLGGLSGLLLLVGLVLAVIWFTRAMIGPGRWSWAAPAAPPAPASAAHDILARRFAAGEITAEEYQKAREVLGGGAKP